MIRTVHVETLGIEVAADPSDDFVVLRVLGIRESAKKPFVSRYSSAIFWRTSTSASDADWVGKSCIELQTLLDAYLVFPTVAK